MKDLVARAEGDASRKAALVEARKALANDACVADTLSALRLKKGLSQSDLAAMYGTSQAHIARIEAGDDVRISTLLKLSAALDLSPSVVLEAATTKLRPRE